jgi:hypothetical protein
MVVRIPLLNRIAAREPDAWPGKRALISHAPQLAESMPAIDGVDLVIETNERGAVEFATEIRAALRARGLLGTPS